MNEIVFFRTNDHGTEVEVQFDGDTVWLSLNQLSALFARDKSVISRHLRNIFQEGELERSAVVAKKATTAKDDKTYEVEFYNLDAIISVGYRVNSKRGTQFRQWATQKLKEHMVQGDSMNSKRLNELGKVVQLLEQSGQTDTLQLEEAKGLLQILTNYTRSFVLLNQYDSRKVKTGKLSENISYQIQYEEAISAIAELKKQLMTRKEASNLFGNEKDESFKSSLQSVVQTFGGQYV